MSAFEEKNRPPPHPWESLESPFLDQEIFAEQSEEEWEPRLRALETASPFLDTFALPGAGAATPGNEYQEESTDLNLEAGAYAGVEFQALAPPDAPARTGVPIIWRDPGDVASKNLIFGIGSKEGQPKPPFRFEKEDKSGTNPKIKVIDANGVRWNIKFDEEVHAEVACSRIVWACGYMVEESYFVPSGKVHGVKGLDRAKKFVRDGTFTNGMFEKRPGNIARRGKQWRWDDNPFKGTRELYGLAMLAFLLNNWDAKPGNNNVLGMHDDGGSIKEWYLVSDWGATLGKTNSKWDLDGYARQTFIESSSAKAVRFHYSGKSYPGSLGESLLSVPRKHVRWFAGIIGKLTDNQIGDAFRAAGATLEEVIGFTQVIRNRINDLKNPFNALDPPYRWICRLEIYDNDLRRVTGYGTGLLISPRHVLTSARVIHDFSRNRRRYSVRITPGYEFGKEPFGSTTASKARVSPKFSPETKDGSADYGVLTLSRPLGSAKYSAIGNAALGWWEEGPTHGFSTSVADWSGKAARMAAFSRSAGGGGGYHKLRVVSSVRFLGLQRGQILHKPSSKLDAPGAPIWIEGGGRNLLVGIASSIFSKDSDVNWGCYLSQETLSHLKQWIKEDFERRELEAGEHFSQDELESLPASLVAEAEGPSAEGYPEQELEDENREAESDADADRFTKPADDNGERQGEESDALDEGEIIGTDNRVHVADTRVVPNRWICAIEVKAKDAAGARGSGVLVGPRHVLTAAHVMRAGDVWDAKLSPARNGDNTSHPFGRFGLKRVRYASAYWVERQRVVNGKVVREQVQRRDDYALVTLDRDLPSQLGFWGQDPAQAQLRALATTALDGSEVTVTGYPGDRCGTTPIAGSNEEQKARRMGECRSRRPDEWASTQWRASGTAQAFDATPTVFYGADTYGGQSGGPVSLVIGGVHVCAGIHINGNTVQNWGVRVTPRMLEDLRAWINSDAGAEIASVVGDALVFRAAAQREEAGTETGESYSYIHEHENDRGDKFVEPNGTAGLGSDEMELDMLTEDAAKMMESEREMKGRNVAAKQARGDQP